MRPRHLLATVGVGVWFYAIGFYLMRALDLELMQ